MQSISAFARPRTRVKWEPAGYSVAGTLEGWGFAEIIEFADAVVEMNGINAARVNPDTSMRARLNIMCSCGIREI
jgi:hypothetical protein